MEPKRIKILYLYAEIMGYNVAVFREYVRNYDAEVHVVHWDTQKHTPFMPASIEGVFYYGKSQFDVNTLYNFALDLQPSILFTSGWMDKDYLKVCVQLRHKQFPIVAISDTPYYATLRQKLGTVYFKCFYRKVFDYLWVSGAYQYEYGKRLGFKNSEIIFNALSADLSIFNPIYSRIRTDKRVHYPHQFLFVGRFASEKGLVLLIKAWNGIVDKKDWTLRLVGNGPLKEYLTLHDSIQITDFVPPEQFDSLVAQSGCLILPSSKEPWALVLHEFAAAGLPIICSDACGAAPVFVISDYNGYTFPSTQVNALQAVMQKIINMSDMELIRFSQRSHQLGQRINPEMAAANSLTVLNHF